jgi:hypothetical protein
MRFVLVMVATVMWLATGCITQKSGGAKGREAFSDPPNTVSSRTTDGKLIVTPETGLAGKVVRVVSSGRFAVLNFPIGRMPLIDQRAEVYRQGLKVGELRITGPQLDDNIVADILTGEVQPGDLVRVQ